MSELMAITVRLPWAAAIRDGEKLVENRGRAIGPEHVGKRIAIHAGVAWSADGAKDPRVRTWWYGHAAARSLSRSDFSHLAGRVLAVATLKDCHQATWRGDPDDHCCGVWADAFYGAPRAGGRPVAWHLVLADVVRLAPTVETRGYLRVPWPLPEDVAAKVLAQLPAVSR